VIPEEHTDAISIVSHIDRPDQRVTNTAELRVIIR